MAQKEIEIILARHLTSYLVMPVFIVDPDGNLLYYNEPAESVLGMRYDETGEMPLADWTTRFKPEDGHGAPLPPERLPLVIALNERHPASGDFWIRGYDQVARHIQVTAFPLIGQANRFLGAVALFWETPRP